MDRAALLKTFVDLYEREHRELGDEWAHQTLDEATRWNLAPVLEAGGVLLFPHVRPVDCGHQVAATVNAVLDSSADRCVFVSVLHANSDEMEHARVAVADGEDPAGFATWGIQGPGIEGRQDWRHDHAPSTFRHLLAEASKRRGVAGPQVVERFPYLAGGRPDLLPGIDELAELCEDAVVVTTGDCWHHGIGYGNAPEDSFAAEQGGFELATASIQQGCELMEQQDYWGYNQHCVQAKSDHRDAGQVLAYVRGPMRGAVIDMISSEFGDVYEAPDPTWVAGTLVTSTPVAAV